MSVNDLAKIMAIALGGILMLITIVGTVLEHKLNKVIKLLEHEK